MTPIRWTEEMCEVLLSMKAAKQPRSLIAERFGISVRAVSAKYEKLRFAAEGPKPKLAKPADERVRRASETKKTKRQTATKAAQEIRRADVGHQDLTSAFCGDPLPGRSALDQKRGIS